MSLFPSIDKSLESKKLSGESSIPKAPIFHSIEWEIGSIVEKIKDISTLNEDEIKSIIIRQHNTILNYDLFLASSDSRQYARDLFTNKRFLEIFLDVSGFLTLSEHEVTCVNKLAYDYYTAPIEKDKEIMDLLMQISNQINNNLVIRLSGIVGINGARLLSIVSNSSLKLEKNVHRVNTFIVKADLALSIQDIINIYCILFPSFTNPFIYTMLEPKPSTLTEEQSKRFDAISLAILMLLDSMTSEDIKRILFNYAFMLKLVKPGSTVRFALKSAKSYTRILRIIEEIETDPLDNNLIIP